jgi:hypothetical protein
VGKFTKLSFLSFLGLILAPFAMAAQVSKGQSTLQTRADVEKAPARFRLQPITGLTYMSLSGPDSGSKIEGTDQKYRYRPEGGHTLGIGLLFPVSSLMNFTTGLQFVRSNSKTNDVSFTESSGGTSYTVRIRSELEMEHLALPLIGTYCFSGCSQWSFFAKGGVIPTYFLGGRNRAVYKTSYSVGGLSATTPERSESARLDDGDLTGLNAMGLVGGGYQFQFNRTLGLLLDMDYVHSFFKLGGDGQAYHQGVWAGAHLTIGL